MVPDVQFERKSSWQKADCVNNNADWVCKRPSTREAVYGTARIRCCTDDKCQERAAQLAKQAGALPRA